MRPLKKNILILEDNSGIPISKKKLDFLLKPSTDLAKTWPIQLTIVQGLKKT